MNRFDGGTSFFGKLRSRGDFVRGGPQGPVEEAVATWLANMVEYSHGELPAQPFRFQFCMADQPALIGAWTPSQDEVGRHFPLAATRKIPAELFASSWSVLPQYYAEFLGELENALSGAFSSVALLASDLERARMPHPSAMPRTQRTASDALAAVRARPFARTVFGDAGVPAFLYAIGTLSRAVALAEESIVLDLPVHGSAELLVWQEMIRVLSAASAPLSALIWSSSCDRALACFGSPSEQTLSFLLDPQHGSSRRWPLWTHSAAALKLVEESLSNAVVSGIRADLPLCDLLKLLSETKN